MADGPIPQGMAGAAANPDTDPETLRQIAYHYPELRATVAENPAAYPGLLEWLGALGEPAVTDALSRRIAGPTAPEATAVMPPVTTPQATTAPIFAPTSSWPEAASGEPNRPQPGTGPTPETTQTWTAQNAAVPGWGASASGGAAGTSGNFGAYGTAPDGGQPGQKNSKRLTITLVILAIVALALTGLVIAIFSGAFSSKPDASASSGPTSAAPISTAQSASPSESPASRSPSPSVSATTAKFPAPSDAQKVGGFTAPSGNISCDLSGDTVSCEIAEQNYAAGGYQDCGDQAVTIVGTADGAALGCGASVSGGGTLAYGASAVSGNVACQSTQDGVSCWNVMTGKGFALARGGWQTGDSGRIGPESYTW